MFAELKDRIEKDLDRIVLKDETGVFNSACPCCTYETTNEPKLTYKMLVAIDGNESLKRVLRTKTLDDDAKLCIERRDPRERPSHMYVEAGKVNEFKNEVTTRRTKSQPIAISHSSQLSTRSSQEQSTEASPIDGFDGESPCVDRWTNLASESTKRMWNIFDESGIFIASCRHAIILKLCDMVRSGEL